MEIHDADADLRASFSPADKLGIAGPDGAFQEVAVSLEIRSPAPAERVRQLVTHAERGCHATQSVRAEVPVRLLARLNGDDLDG